MFPSDTDSSSTRPNMIFLGVLSLVLWSSSGRSPRRSSRPGAPSPPPGHRDPLARGVRGSSPSAPQLPPRPDRELPGPRCERAFDCRGATTHARLVADAKPLPAIDAGGFFVLADRLYQRPRLVKAEEDGTVTLGLDDLASVSSGHPTPLVLPAVGERLAENGPAFRLKAGKARVRVASPVSGEVVETGSFAKGFLLRVKPDGPLDTRALLSGREAAAFFGRERDRLQLVLSAAQGIPALADGGVLVGDLSSAIPEEDRDRVLGEMLLES